MGQFQERQGLRILNSRVSVKDESNSPRVDSSCEIWSHGAQFWTSGI